MKRSEILEKYKDLIQEDVELVRLEPVDDLSDDTASSVLNKFDGSILALFVLSQKTSKDGFVEKYMLSEKDVKRIDMLRQMLEEDPTLKEQIISVIEESLNILYSKASIYGNLQYFQMHEEDIMLEEKIPVLKKIK